MAANGQLPSRSVSGCWPLTLRSKPSAIWSRIIRPPQTAWFALTASSLAIMLGMAKRRLGGRLGSGATAGEGSQNLMCAAHCGRPGYPFSSLPDAVTIVLDRIQCAAPEPGPAPPLPDGPDCQYRKLSSRRCSSLSPTARVHAAFQAPTRLIGKSCPGLERSGHGGWYARYEAPPG